MTVNMAATVAMRRRIGNIARLASLPRPFPLNSRLARAARTQRIATRGRQ